MFYRHCDWLVTKKLKYIKSLLKTQDKTFYLDRLSQVHWLQRRLLIQSMTNFTANNFFSTQGRRKLKMIWGAENIITKVIREHALPGRTFWQTILSEMPILCISGNFKFWSLIVYVSLLINVLRGKVCKCSKKKIFDISIIGGRGLGPPPALLFRRPCDWATWKGECLKFSLRSLQVPDAIAQAQKASVKVCMITGDNLSSAGAFAAKTNILATTNDWPREQWSVFGYDSSSFRKHVLVSPGSVSWFLWFSLS